MDFKDSLKVPSPSAPRHIEKILSNVGVVDSSWKCPARTNRGYQQGGWECGLWATRYLEQSLREQRSEGRTPPASIKEQSTRLNKFIDQLKGAREKRDGNKASDGKKDEAKARAKAKIEKAAAEALAKKVEPVWATLDEALIAGRACPKCYVTHSQAPRAAELAWASFSSRSNSASPPGRGSSLRISTSFD